MARFNVVDMHVLDDMISGVGKLPAAVYGPESDKVLLDAGGKLAEYFRGAIQQRGLVDTGQLWESIKPTKIRAQGTAGKYVDVYPQGNRRREGRKKAVRNAAVGFIQEYGQTRSLPKKSTPATHWMSDTVDDVGEDILDIMQAGIDEIIDKNLGGK